MHLTRPLLTSVVILVAVAVVHATVLGTNVNPTVQKTARNIKNLKRDRLGNNTIEQARVLLELLKAECLRLLLTVGPGPLYDQYCAGILGPVSTNTLDKREPREQITNIRSDSLTQF